MTDSKQTTLTTQLRDGELEHVVVVKGERVQAHTSQAAAMCALMLALACQGCATVTDFVQDHPRTTAVITGVVVLSAVMTLEQNHKHGPVTTEPRMSAPLTPNCTVYPEMCK